MSIYDTLTATSLTWRGTTFDGGQSGRLGLSEVEGWEELPPQRRVRIKRPSQHGTMGFAPTSEDRTIRAAGQCSSPAERDALLIELGALFTYASPDGRAEDLTIEKAGRALSVRAYLTRYQAIVTSELWSMGMFRWQAEWVADDPLRYGPRISAPTSFPVAVGGLRWPLYSNGAGVNVGALDYGPVSTTGRLLLANPGTAAAAIQHEVVGPVDAAGFEIIEIGGSGRLVYEGPVPAGSTLLLDGGNGAVLMDGYADRGDVLTSRVWPVAARKSSVELFFRPRGSTSAATLTSSLAPAYW